MNEILKGALEGLEVVYLMGRFAIRDLIGLSNEDDEVVDTEDN